MRKTLLRTALLGELAEITRKARDVAEQQLLSLDPSVLNRKPDPKAWSAAGCLFHLNYYAAYYHPAIRRALDKAPTTPGPAAEIYQPGWLGDYFARTMKAPGGIPKKKLPTLPASAPQSDNYPQDIVRQFIDLQDEMLGLLKRAAAVDLGKASTGTTATELIRMKLGDALRVVIYHNERHIYQALRAVEAARTKG